MATGCVYWNELKSKLNYFNDLLSKAMTTDILNLIKEKTNYKVVPFGNVTNEEADAGLSSKFWRLKLIFDGSYSGSRGFSSQDQG